MTYRIFEYDPYLLPYKRDIIQRMKNYHDKKRELLGERGRLIDFANGHEYFGFHKSGDGSCWYYREWAPGADNVYVMGDMNGWNKTSLKLAPLENGVFEIILKGENMLYDGCRVKTVVEKNGVLMERVPLYINRAVQDERTYTFCGEIEDRPAYNWQVEDFALEDKLYIYECHIGMAQEKEGIGSYNEFTDNILPRIKALGYNAIQIMAIMEHPYYGSFGYQVSSFFAPSSKYGRGEDLKRLVDTAHKMGIGVLLDVVHSHAVKNVGDGINMFDGTEHQFFHTGQRGEHPTWNTKLFNYNKNEVIHFLLSNLKYWMTNYHFDGFRFDGVTSMIYHDHGLGTAFTDYGKYFSLNTETEAITYLQLANELIKQVNPKAITIAEDMSAMPGMCLRISDGGIGFDYRLSMGIPDMWIRLIEKQTDDSWSMGHIWYELTNRRPHERYIGYAESHDQALVGDKTIMFRLCDSEMYTAMDKADKSLIIDRGIALHKLIRFVTMTLGGEGYLNFMGNEFGHPEWIDFPRAENNWSYFYCRRQWHLADNGYLKYEYLGNFDKALVDITKENDIFSHTPVSLYIDEEKQVMVYRRGEIIFAVNFSPKNSYTDYFVKTGARGMFRPVLSTDSKMFGGYDRISLNYDYKTRYIRGKGSGFGIYLPARTAVCLKKITSTEQ